MKTFIAVVVALVVVVGGWWWFTRNQAPAGTQSNTSDTTQTQNQYQYIPDNLLLGRDATTTLGTYLIGSSGMTLYTYSKDASSTSNCYDACAANWPPYTIQTRDVLANIQAGIPGKADAITRQDGTLQVTYNGQPLYFYIKDKVSGDTTGQNVGGVWFVAKP